MTDKEKEELVRIQKERIWNGDGLRVYKAGEPMPHHGPTPIPQWPWEAEMTDQMGNTQQR